MDNKDPWVVTRIDAEIPTPEAGDNYLGESILLAGGATTARAKVKARQRDSDGNVVGQANPNPIKDTRTY